MAARPARRRAGLGNTRMPARGPGPRRAYLATGMVNSAPLSMLSGQRCITLL